MPRIARLENIERDLVMMGRRLTEQPVAPDHHG
jgi:hypothetical protein